MSQILLDNFTGSVGPLSNSSSTGHTSDSGHTYAGNTSGTVLNGSGQITSGNSTLGGNALLVSTAPANSSSTKDTMSATYTLPATAGATIALACFVSSNLQYCYLALINGAGGVNVFKKVAGTLTSVGSVSGQALTGTAKTFSFEVSSGSQVVKIDGATVASFSDTAVDGSQGRFFGGYMDGPNVASVDQWTGTDSLGGSIAAGTASVTSIGNALVNLTTTAPTGGTGPYTYQWQKSTTSGSGFSNISGATTATYQATGLTNGTAYYFKCVYTDAASATATSNEVTGTPLAIVDIAATDANIKYYLPNVQPGGGIVQGIDSGLLFETYFTGDACTLLFDTTNAPAVDLQIRVNGGTIQRTALASQVVVTMATTGAKAQTNRLEVFVNTNNTTSGLWGSGTGGWKFAGLRLQSGKAAVAPPSRRTAEFWGDSITSRVLALGDGSTNDQTTMDNANGWPVVLATLLGLRPVCRGKGGTGINSSGTGSVPGLLSNYAYAFASNAYAPSIQPDLLCIHIGTNSGGTQSDYQSVITAGRAARPGARMLLIAPPGKGLYATIVAAVAAVGEKNAAVVDLGTFLSALNGEDFTDSVGHLNVGGNQKAALSLATPATQLMTTASLVAL